MVRQSPTSRKRRVSSSKIVNEHAQHQSSLPDQVESFVPYLSHITEGSTVKELNPRCCIPLYLSRARSENAEERLVAIIDGGAISNAGYDDARETTLTGFVSGSPTSVVVPLVGDLVYLLDEHFEDQGLAKEDAEDVKKSQGLWFGVVDGCQLHGALSKCQKRWPKKLEDFLWKVFVVRAGLPVEECQKLAVVQNERCRQANHYEPTMYELLNGLRTVHDSMLYGRSKPSRSPEGKVKFTHRDVAFNYDGGNHEKNTPIKQAVSLAIRLSKRTLDAIGIVSNMACPEMILNNSTLNSRKLTCTNDVLRTYDCRVFKHILCPSTIRGAPNFLNAMKEGDEEAQVNTVYRSRHWSESNGYKPLKPENLSDQFIFAKRALVEEQKFLSHIGAEKWPDCMSVARSNLLQSTAFDEDLGFNEGNDHFVLESVWELFSQNFPARAKQLGRKMCSDTETEPSSDHPPPPPDNDPPIPPPSPSRSVPGASDGDEMSKEKEAADAAALEALRLKEEQEKKAAEERRKEAERNRLMRRDADRILKECDIETLHTTLHHFLKSIWTSASPKFDMILSALPRNCDDKILEKLPSFCKDTLKAGSYVVFVVSEEQFPRLRVAFGAASFKVCQHSYKVHYDPRMAKRKRNADFPQRHDDICLIAKTQGRHPTDFVPDFAMTYEQAEVPTATFLASVFNVQACQQKLKAPNQNSPIFPEEKSIDLFVHLLRLFSPRDGRILDPFGGPLSVSLACYKTSRTCTAIDGSEPGFRYAMGRLRIFATPEKTMSSLETYIDVDAEPSVNNNSDAFKDETKTTECKDNEGDQAPKHMDSSTVPVDASLGIEDLSSSIAPNESDNRAKLNPSPSTSCRSKQDSSDKDAIEATDVDMQTESNNIPKRSDNSDDDSFRSAEEDIGISNSPASGHDDVQRRNHFTSNTAGVVPCTRTSTRLATRAMKEQKVLSNTALTEDFVQGVDAIIRLTNGQ